MKILAVVQAYAPVKGGAEWLFQQLCEELANRHQDEVTVFTTAVSKPTYFWRNEGEPLPVGTETINSVTVRRFPVFRGLRWLRALAAHSFHRLKLPFHDWARTLQVGPIIWGLSKEVAQSDADVILAGTFPFLHIEYALAGAKKGKKPIVLLGAFHADDKWAYDRKHFYDAVTQADAYIALTRFEKRLMVSRGAKPDQVHVVGAGVSMEPFAEKDGAVARRRYGWGDDPVVMVLTRQSALKGLDKVMVAMPIVWQSFPNARLLLAGARREYTAVLEAWSNNLPTAHKQCITLVNDFPEEEKAELLAAANFLVHTSVNESFGIVFLEAWAAGVPVIGANVGAIASLIDDGVDGLLFEPNNGQDLAQKMKALLAEPDKQLEMGKNGFLKVQQHFSWEKIAHQTRTILMTVVEQKKHLKRVP